jgi:hypothetical protein
MSLLVQVRRRLLDTAEGVLDGTVERDRGTAAAQLYTAALRCLELERKQREQDEVLARIARLEAGAVEAAQANGGEWWRRR